MDVGESVDEDDDEAGVRISTGLLSCDQDGWCVLVLCV